MNGEILTGKKPSCPISFKRFLLSLLITLPMWIATLVIITHLNFSNTCSSIAKLCVYFLVNVLFFLAVYTGKTDKYRAILFITASVCFSFSFVTTLYSLRGDFMVLTNEQIASCNVPFCHFVIPQTFITALLNKEFIFPGSFDGFLYTIPAMIIIWIAITLALGRGWCSWACFYGGWEEGFSRMRRKPVIKKISSKLLMLPFAVLLTIALISAATLSPQYCWWLCPFKAVTEFPEITSIVRVIQTVIFVVIFVGLVVILPILTGKRTQCSFLCPFGAMQSFTNRISPFEIRIDREKCVKCMKCIKDCSFYAIDESSISTGKTRMNCTKCGRCVDNCPQKAIHYHIKGTKMNVGGGFARIIFIYTAFIIIAAFGGGFIADAIYKVLTSIFQ